MRMYVYEVREFMSFDKQTAERIVYQLSPTAPRSPMPKCLGSFELELVSMPSFVDEL